MPNRAVVGVWGQLWDCGPHELLSSRQADGVAEQCVLVSWQNEKLPHQEMGGGRPAVTPEAPEK